MYGLSKDLDLNFLNGREVVQVAIGVYQIQFGFDDDVIIYVESEFNYFDGQEEWIWKPESGVAQIVARMVSLLSSTIRYFDRQENGMLILTCSIGELLTILVSGR